ncbi:hypothetical protein Oweho_0656 [Owenweeksia hongkongensis DSM 17368]|uniref:MORN repeat protein n=1 Tax=Owenweeksia hongkongensis (strain DSM 17368 / CIP 108786 / JCM 12287 / NRRL B-23963 / UST20020801) TaxID=926562 RepID=G8R0Z9_OWEHD|nr:hypothetical protein [Owenweeksia hongkongensis]AEV31670.1 hypothetical protein Oweho_0656 [Owenweeksia hongkongensis DSM 17368]
MCLPLFACQQSTVAGEITSETAEDTVLQSNLRLDPNKGLVYYQNRPFSGFSISYYQNAIPSETIQYRKGKKEGKLKKWFSDGTLSFEATYADGKLHGITKSWWSNGYQRSETNYVEGKVDGKLTQWYNTGDKFKELNYTMGQENGMQKAWRKNGKLYSNYEARDGRIFGLKRANLCYELKDEEVQFSE